MEDNDYTFVQLGDTELVEVTLPRRGLEVLVERATIDHKKLCNDPSQLDDREDLIRYGATIDELTHRLEATDE